MEQWPQEQGLERPVDLLFAVTCIEDAVSADVVQVRDVWEQLGDNVVRPSSWGVISAKGQVQS